MLAPLRRRGLLDCVCRLQVFTAADCCRSLALVCNHLCLPTENTAYDRRGCFGQDIIRGMRAISSMNSRSHSQQRLLVLLRPLTQQYLLLLRKSHHSQAQPRNPLLCLRHQQKS